MGSGCYVFFGEGKPLLGDLKEMRSQLYSYLGEEHSKQREEQVQRSLG